MSLSSALSRIAAACSCAVLLSAALTGCGPASGTASGGASASEQSASAPSGPIPVVAAENTWGSIAESIGGDEVKVTSIVDSSDTDMTSFAPTADQKAQIADAQIVIVDGAGYDTWASDQTTRDQTVINAASTVGATDGDNPFLWMSSDTRRGVADAVADALMKAAPDSSDIFQKNLDEWKAAEDELDTKIDDLKSKHKDAHYLATAPAAYYLLAEAGMTDDTPDDWSKSMTKGQTPDENQVTAMTKAVTTGSARLLLNDTQRPTSATDTVLAAAGTVQGMQVLALTETMPPAQNSLHKWLSQYVDDVSDALDAAQKAANASASASASGSASGSTSASAGDGSDSASASASN